MLPSGPKRNSPDCYSFCWVVRLAQAHPEVKRSVVDRRSLVVARACLSKFTFCHTFPRGPNACERTLKRLVLVVVGVVRHLLVVLMVLLLELVIVRIIVLLIDP